MWSNTSKGALKIASIKHEGRQEILKTVRVRDYEVVAQMLVLQ